MPFERAVRAQSDGDAVARWRPAERPRSRSGSARAGCGPAPLPAHGARAKPATHTARFPAQAFGFEFSGSMNECVRLYVCFTAVIKSIHANLTRTAYSTEYISMMCMQKVPGRGASCHTLPPFRFSVLRLRLRFSVQPAITAIPACSVPCIDPGSGASSNVTSTTSTSSACSAATCIASFILCW